MFPPLKRTELAMQKKTEMEKRGTTSLFMCGVRDNMRGQKKDGCLYWEDGGYFNIGTRNN